MQKRTISVQRLSTYTLTHRHPVTFKSLISDFYLLSGAKHTKFREPSRNKSELKLDDEKFIGRATNKTDHLPEKNKRNGATKLDFLV